MRYLILREQLEGFVPAIPDWANDKHTIEGKKLGRGMKHFGEEGAKLHPPPAQKDAYEDQAHRLWELKAKQLKAKQPKAKPATGELFEVER